METRVAGASPTAREREVARLIGLGLTNKEIAARLHISERTVGAHIQNILNKLGASNRAQIAAWSAHASPISATTVAPVAAATHGVQSRTGRLMAVAVFLALVFPADHQVQPATAAAEVAGQRGELVYEASFNPDGRDFSVRYALNDLDASSVQIVNGGIEYSVLKQGGNTGNRPAMVPLPAYFAEYEMSVRPRSNVGFWISFSNDDASLYGVHLLDIETGVETMQLAYSTGGDEAPLPLGPQVEIKGLQSGRKFAISTLVQPPIYRVFLDGVRVIDLRHESVRRLVSPGFGIFGDLGMVRLTAIRVYRVD